jgi:hypothetical protein
MFKPLLFIIILIFVSLEFLQSNANGEISKRLLLNDPDIVHARLSQLEKKQQEMTGQILQLQGDLSSENTKTSTIETIVNFLIRFKLFVFIVTLNNSYANIMTTRANGKESFKQLYQIDM